jgi:HlyD family secretion protein
MATPLLLFRGEKQPALKLTEFGFHADMPETSGDTEPGQLTLGDATLDIQFRARGEEDGRTVCSFVDLTIEDSEVLRKFLADQDRGFVVSSDLEEKTYDQLAAGEIAGNTPKKKSKSRTGIKAFAFFAIVATILVLLGGTFFFLRSRSSLEVSNSALSGNYIPVNSAVEGEITEVTVRDGQFVSAGEILLRLRNPELERAKADLVAQHNAAARKIEALRRQQSSYKDTLLATTQRLALGVKLSQAEVKTATSQLDAARATVDRLRPFKASGAVTASEIEIAEKQYLVAEAALNTAKSQLEVRDFALDAAATKKIVFVGDRVDTEPNRLAAEITIAEAEYEALSVACDLAKRRIDELVVRAPRDGQIHVTYRHVGEFLRATEQVVALSVGGNVWAAGHVETNQALRIRPGQPVTVTVPSTGRALTGVVSAVGHRSLYSKGGYTADFRGSAATDVPVKVTIPDLPDQLPSGIRLKMVINTGFGVEWIDRFFEYELQPVGPPQRMPGNDSSPKNQDSLGTPTVARATTR